MELVDHVEELAQRADNLVDANNSMLAVADNRNWRNLNGLLLPELYKAEGRVIKELGRSAFSLIKLAPHIPEIYRMKNEGRAL